VPAKITRLQGIQPRLQMLPGKMRVSIRDPRPLEGLADGIAYGNPPCYEHWCGQRLARQMARQHNDRGRPRAVIATSAKWEQIFADSIGWPGDDKSIAMALRG